MLIRAVMYRGWVYDGKVLRFFYASSREIAMLSYVVAVRGGFRMCRD